MTITKLNSTIILFISITLMMCGENKSDKKEKKVFTPPVSYEEASEWADSILKQMTPEEKIGMIGGVDNFYTHAYPRLNVPGVFMSDATQGVHLRDEFGDDEMGRAIEKSTAFPCPVLLASTWNTELAEQYARSIGEECRAAGVGILLGPGMNIYRISQCGRNFEYFGEDPFLAGSMIRNYVYGIESTGTIATLKHFLCNNTDFFRRKSNSIVDERTIHEIYLPAFKEGVDAGAMAVMTSYNQLNGEWTGQSDYVINQVLRNELGFKWLVMTDWWSVYDGEKVIGSGQDLEMPRSIATENTDSLLKVGKVTMKQIERMVKSTLTTLYAMQSFSRDKDSSYLSTFGQHTQTALQTAREGIVMLKNNGILPLQNTSDKKILVTGYWLDSLAYGGGSAEVQGYDIVMLIDALKKEFGEQIDYNPAPDSKDIAGADIVIFSAGTGDSEGWDRPFDLPEEQETRIRQCVGLNSNTVVIVSSGSGINMSNWNNKAAAILYAWYRGQAGNVAVAEILSGKVNPSGKLPITIEKRFDDSPGYGYIPEGEKLYKGWNEEGESGHKVYDIHYNEGIFVGYRWYEKKDIEPLYPFGFGLSYTNFEYSDLKVSKSSFKPDDIVEVSFIIKNTGKVAGAEIAQLYINDKESSLPRPVKELKGFSKIFVDPGESKKVIIALEKKDFSFWNPETKQWFAEPGKFEILVGSSSKDIRATTEIDLLE